MARSKSTLDFDQAIKKLEQIVSRLEEQEISLESALDLFAEGQTLVRACEQKLESAENRIRQLVEDKQGTIREEPLETDVEDADGETDRGEDDPPEDDDSDFEPDDPPPPPAPPRPDNLPF